jgi:NhaP-type Na+/H+ or K+/H+ antiporter
MATTIQTILMLLVVLVVVAVVARRLNIAPSILLVIAGIALALVPGLPRIEFAPELVLLGILPPLIYSAGVAMSWREFRFNLRPITLLAFGCVVFTSCAVSAVAHFLLGMQPAVGFVLGAIVAPTDVVAPLAIVRRLGIPRRLVVVLEGEGLANDATALIVYRFAVAAVSTGLFSLPEAAGSFALIVVGEIAYGIGVGWFSLRLRCWARDPRVEITLSLMTPYAAFLVPAHLGGSGVLARGSWLVRELEWTAAHSCGDTPAVVSLAAALAIPLGTAAGSPFPRRDLILFVTFGVIVLTLIGQGLLLPSIVRWLGLARHTAVERRREHEAELAARSEALKVAQKRLERLAADGQLSPDALTILRARHEYRAGRLPKTGEDKLGAAAAAADLRAELIAGEREYIYRLLQDGKITDEARRRIERELDLEEASIDSKRDGTDPPL